MIRWRGFDLETHAGLARSNVLHRIKQRTQKPEQILDDVLLEALREAFEAGVRLGTAQQEDRLQETIRDYVSKALEKVPSFCSASCPDCAGRGCDECGNTGNFRTRR